MDGARLRETVAPLALLGGGAVAAGVFCALPLTASSLAASLGVTPDAYSLLKLGALVPLAALGVALAEVGNRVSLRLATRRAMVRRE